MAENKDNHRNREDRPTDPQKLAQPDRSQRATTQEESKRPHGSIPQQQKPESELPGQKPSKPGKMKGGGE